MYLDQDTSTGLPLGMENLEKLKNESGHGNRKSREKSWKIENGHGKYGISIRFDAMMGKRPEF